ncbi:MAG: DUF4172 domain-containing protein [Gammaproteobacteria bacterium]|nr:DUF4172 domain-containing protein [Gammaproteobacteria bacterium]
MSWLWNLQDWPNFRWDAQALAPLETRFLRGSGQLTGTWRHLDETDQLELRVDWLTGEAFETSAIGQGTEDLKTVVAVGNRLVWIIYPLECEAYVAIDDIAIDKEICEPEKNAYTGTDIAYWVGIVKKDITLTPYTIKFKVGNRLEPIATTSSLYLIGKNT